MSIKRLMEKELLKDLDAKSAHAKELAEPLPQELTPPGTAQGHSQTLRAANRPRLG